MFGYSAINWPWMTGCVSLLTRTDDGRRAAVGLETNRQAVNRPCTFWRWDDVCRHWMKQEEEEEELLAVAVAIRHGRTAEPMSNARTTHTHKMNQNGRPCPNNGPTNDLSKFLCIYRWQRSQLGLINGAHCSLSICIYMCVCVCVWLVRRCVLAVIGVMASTVASLRARLVGIS